MTRTAIVIATVLAAFPVRADCAGCHAGRHEPWLRAPVALVAGDIHGEHGGCSACHGGDPNETTMRAHDLARGFRGRTRGLATVLLCSGCHEEIGQDVRGGAHGIALAEDRFAASCTDCHAAHGVRAPRPLERNCTECHGNARRMAASGLATDQARQWRASVHGLLHAAGDERAPDCAGCHDPHRAQAGLAASASCASCHESVRAAFDRGPHARRFRELGFLDCTECHGSHEVRAADATLLRGVTAVCARCHRDGSEMFAEVRGLVEQSSGVEAARTLARDDPRRVRVIDALHALDVEGLAQAIEALPAARAPAPARRATTRALPPMFDLARALGAALFAFAILWLAQRWRR